MLLDLKDTICSFGHWPITAGTVVNLFFIQNNTERLGKYVGKFDGREEIFVLKRSSFVISVNTGKACMGFNEMIAKGDFLAASDRNSCNSSSVCR